MFYSLGTCVTYHHFGAAAAVADNPRDSEIVAPQGDDYHKLSTLTNHQESICLKASLCGRYYACISPLVVSIYSAGHRRVLLARLQRSTSTSLFGFHSMAAAWSVDGSTLYVCTQPGYYVCIYRFINSNEVVVADESSQGYPRSVIGLGGDEPYNEFENNNNGDEDEDLCESDDPGGRSLTQGRAARRRLMALYESRNETILCSKVLSFAAVLKLPVCVTDIGISLKYILFGCAVQPVIFVMAPSQPKAIKEVLRLTDITVADSLQSLPSISRGSVPNNNAFLYSPTEGSISLYFKQMQNTAVGEGLFLDSDPPTMITSLNDATTTPYEGSPLQKEAPVGIQQFELNESLDLLAIVLTTGCAAILAWNHPFTVLGCSNLKNVEIILDKENSPSYIPLGYSGSFSGTSNHDLVAESALPTIMNPIGVLIRTAGVVCVKMNRPRRVAAVAYTKGFIDIISLSNLFEENRLRRIRRIDPCDALGLSQSLGQFRSMRWSRDGLALVVSWAKIGPIVLDHTGAPAFVPFRRRIESSPIIIQRQMMMMRHKSSSFNQSEYDLGLQNTDNEQQQQHPLDSSVHSLEGVIIDHHMPNPRLSCFRPESRKFSGLMGVKSIKSNQTNNLEVIPCGVLAAEWISFDLALVVCYENEPHLLTEFKFYRNGCVGVAAGTPGASAFTFGASQPSRVMIGAFDFAIAKGELWSPTTPKYNKIPLPPHLYTKHNWPLRLAILSPSGEWLLTVGRWGIALYAFRLRRWRVFGNEQHERALHTEALPIGWYSHDVFFICYRDEVGELGGPGGGTQMMTSKADALKSLTMEHTVRRKLLHKPSINLMKEPLSGNSTTSFNILFFDAACRLDIDTAVAKISDLPGRPLKICMFSVGDCFKPSIATLLHNGDAMENAVSSPFLSMHPLFVDPTRPGGLYVECLGIGTSTRSCQVPQLSCPMPLIAVYDDQMNLTAFRFIPSKYRPILKGSKFGVIGQRVSWDVENLWTVNFKEAGWTDHPIDIRFIGSDHHLLIHHVNGNVTSVTLNDSRPTILSLLDDKLVTNNNNNKNTTTNLSSKNVTLTPMARDEQSWCLQENIRKADIAPLVAKKEFIESLTLQKNVSCMWSSTRSQLPYFFPIPTSPLRPYQYPRSKDAISSPILRVVESPAAYQSTTLQNSKEHQRSTSSSSPKESCEKASSDSPQRFVETVVESPRTLPVEKRLSNTAINAESPSQQKPPSKSQSSPRFRFGFKGLAACTIGQRAQPSSFHSQDQSSCQNDTLGEDEAYENISDTTSSSSLCKGNQAFPQFHINQFYRGISDGSLAYGQRASSLPSRKSLKIEIAKTCATIFPGKTKESVLFSTKTGCESHFDERQQANAFAAAPETDFIKMDYSENLKSKSELEYMSTLSEWPISKSLVSIMQQFCNVAFEGGTHAPNSFCEDLERKSPGLYVWCETDVGMTLLTVSRQMRTTPQRFKYTQIDRSFRQQSRGAPPLASNEGRCEGNDYRYKTFELLKFDKRGPAARNFDVVALEGTLTLCHLNSMFSNDYPFECRPMTSLRFEKVSIFHPILSMYLSIEPIVGVYNGFMLAQQLTTLLKGNTQFPQILEFLLHQILDENVSSFRTSAKAFFNDQLKKSLFLEINQIFCQVSDVRKHQEMLSCGLQQLQHSKSWNHQTLSSSTAAELTPLNTDHQQHQPNSFFYHHQLNYALIQTIKDQMLFIGKDNNNNNNQHFILYIYCCLKYASFRRLLRLLFLLKDYHQSSFAHIIIAAVRKTEPLTTPAIVFPLLGLRPQDLFATCLSQRKLKEASLYLIVLQHLLGPLEVRTQFAIPLFRECLKWNHFRLARSVTTFFDALYVKKGAQRKNILNVCSLLADPIQDSSHLLWAPEAIKIGGQSPPVVAGDADGVDKIAAANAYIAFENCVLNTVRECFEKFEWLRLLFLTFSLDLNLEEWLTVERDSMSILCEVIQWREHQRFEKNGLNISALRKEKDTSSIFVPSDAPGSKKCETQSRFSSLLSSSGGELIEKSEVATLDQQLSADVTFSKLIKTFKKQFQCRSENDNNNNTTPPTTTTATAAQTHLHLSPIFSPPKYPPSSDQNTQEDGRATTTTTTTKLLSAASSKDKKYSLASTRDFWKTLSQTSSPPPPAKETIDHLSNYYSDGSYEVQSSPDSTSFASHFRKKSPHLFLSPKGYQKTTTSSPQMIQKEEKGGDQFLRYLFHIFLHLRLFPLIAAIAMATTNIPLLHYVYGLDSNIEEFVQLYVMNEVFERKSVPEKNRDSHLDEEIVAPYRSFPAGLTLWRETLLGITLQDALADLNAEGILEIEAANYLLEIFDQVMTLRLPKCTPATHFRIVSGGISQYKNLDGTWVFYLKDFAITDKKRTFATHMIRVIATEIQTLETASKELKRKQKKRLESYTIDQLFV